MALMAATALGLGPKAPSFEASMMTRSKPSGWGRLAMW